jgi:cell division protein FtsL
MLFLPLEIVASVFLVAVAAAVVAIAFALFAIRKQEKEYQIEGRTETLP